MQQDKGARLHLDKGEDQVVKLFDAQVASPQKQRQQIDDGLINTGDQSTKTNECILHNPSSYSRGCTGTSM